MSEAFIPLSIPTIGEVDKAFLIECIDSTFVSSVGPFVDEFEAKVAELHGAQAGVAVNSGTSALHVGLVALGVQPADLVICPSFTFIATANAIRHQHAVPVLLDVTERGWTLNPMALRRFLDESCSRTAAGDTVHDATGKRVAAVVPVYTLGAVADMLEIGAICTERGLPLLADAAAAIGAGHPVESLARLADLSAFSFNGNKTITTGGGGMLLGVDAALMDKVRHLTTTARVSENYDYDEVGYNYRMTNLQAALGCAQLTRLDDFVASKRRIRARYDQAFESLPGTSAFPNPPASGSVCWFSGLVLDREHPIEVVDLCRQLRDRGIQARPFWKPVHLQKPYADVLHQDLEVTERLWSRIVTLPCSAGLSPRDQERVIDVVRELLGGGA